jgi:hypothetical protein
MTTRRRKTRGGTAASLASTNEVLLAREECVETDTGRRKIGDGTTAYNSLPYMHESGGGGGSPAILAWAL